MLDYNGLIEMAGEPIETPLGTLSCAVIDDNDYPSVRLYVDGIHVAILEYDIDKKALRVQTFSSIDVNDEEPCSITLTRPV